MLDNPPLYWFWETLEGAMATLAPRFRRPCTLLRVTFKMNPGKAFGCQNFPIWLVRSQIFWATPKFLANFESDWMFHTTLHIVRHLCSSHLFFKLSVVNLGCVHYVDSFRYSSESYLAIIQIVRWLLNSIFVSFEGWKSVNKVLKFSRILNSSFEDGYQQP